MTEKNQDIHKVEEASSSILSDKDADSKAAVSILESVSALMDGETSALELRRVIKDSSRVPEISASWRRYHLIRDCLQQEVHSNPGVNLLEGINARLANEEQPLGNYPMHFKFRGLLRRMGQGAIAASVAFTVLYGASALQLAVQDSGLATGQLADNNQVDSNSLNLQDGFNPSSLSRTVSMDSAERERLQRAVFQITSNQDSPLSEPYIAPDHVEAALIPEEK
jgi:negative regulator of sigma E activity